MYDVLGAKAGKRPWELKEIKVKNDLGQERWYGANKFNLLEDSAAVLKEYTVAGAEQRAAQSATPDGKQIYMGTGMVHGTDIAICGKSIEMTDIEKTDAAAGYMVREELKARKAAAEGIADGFGLYYGA